MRSKIAARPACLALIAWAFTFAAEAQQQPTLDLPKLDSQGGVVLNVRGLAGTNYALEASSDLGVWWKLFSGVATNGSVGFNYTPPSDGQSRFFRAKMEVPLLPPNMTIGVDTNLFVPILVTPEDGGTQTMFDDRGVAYTLTVPTNAVAFPQVLYVNMVTNLSGLPIAAGLLAGVTISPSGVSLLAPASLVVTFPAEMNIDTTQLAGYTYDTNGQSLQLAPAVMDTNSVSLSMAVVENFGCSIATPAEVRQLGSYVSSNYFGSKLKPGFSRSKGAIRNDGIQAQSTHLTFLAMCYPDQNARANAVEAFINGAIASFGSNLGEQGLGLLATYHHYPSPARGEYWAGDTPQAYEDFFNQNIKPYLTEAQSNCQLMVALANGIFSLTRMARNFLYDGDIPGVKESAAAICNAYQNCINETQGCCLTKIVGGEGPVDELKSILEQAGSWGCSYPASAINAASNACNPGWSGKITIFETRSNDVTQNLATTTQHHVLDYWVKTVLNSDHVTVDASTYFANMSGTVKGTVTGHYGSLDETIYLNCECGDCKDDTYQFCEVTTDISGSIGLLWCTSPTNSFCPPNFVPVFTPDTNTAPNLIQPSILMFHHVISHKVGDTCVPEFTYSHSRGTQTFPDGALAVNLADHMNGTANHVDGDYSNNYDEGDGTIHTIMVTWSFDKNP